MKRTVVFSILGTTLDQVKRRKRLGKWRPNISLCMQPGLFVDRLELIHGETSQKLASNVVSDLQEVAPATRVREHILNMDDPWDFAEVYNALRDFARGYPFDPDHEDYLVNITTGTHVAQICWFLLTEAHLIPARLIQLSPPQNREEGDGFVGTYKIIDLDLSRYDDIAKRFASERLDATNFLKSGISTRNAAFNQMIDEIERVVIRSTAPVLLMGPTGAGKSQLARKIFELKKRERKIIGAFVEVNCATLRGDQAMSTLFGHVKGAFTGAQGERAGLMKTADKGVLFLDEIGELGLDEQAMCLRALEEKRFFPYGSDREIAVDFQLIAGTNKNLAKAVAEGKFREDLFARLNLWTFQLPALRERPEDIEPNLDFELHKHLETEGQNITFNREARDMFLTFATGSNGVWRGNFRDLSASVTRMATFAAQGRITCDVVEKEIQRLKQLWKAENDSKDDWQTILTEILGADGMRAIDRFDAVQLADVIKVCRLHTTVSAAGRALFAHSRDVKKSKNDADRLVKFLAKFNLRFDDFL